MFTKICQILIFKLCYTAECPREAEAELGRESVATLFSLDNEFGGSCAGTVIRFDFVSCNLFYCKIKCFQFVFNHKNVI